MNGKRAAQLPLGRRGDEETERRGEGERAAQLLLGRRGDGETGRREANSTVAVRKTGRRGTRERNSVLPRTLRKPRSERVSSTTKMAGAAWRPVSVNVTLTLSLVKL